MIIKIEGQEDKIKKFIRMNSIWMKRNGLKVGEAGEKTSTLQEPPKARLVNEGFAPKKTRTKK